MANRQEVQNSLLQAIDTIVHKRVDELDFDKTILATIENVVSPATGEHRLKYNGGSFSAFSKDGVSYEPNTLVYVQIPQNDFSKRKIIIDRASNVRSDNDIAIVSSNINNYMTLGVNTVKLKSEFKDSAKNGVGLNSYTPRDYLPGKKDEYYPFQDSIVLYDRATDGGLYDLDTTSLNTFLQEADALMIKANFRAILTQEQQLQANAEYALVADLVFSNVDNTYKTQGEMLKALEDKTVSEKTSTNADATITTVNVTMGTYRKKIDALFETATTNSSAQSIESAFNLVNNFISLNAGRFTKQEEQIFTAFYQLGADLQNIAKGYNDNNENEKKVRYSKQYLAYQQWFDKLLNEGEPSEKTLSYVIDSSHMIGNPFNYGTYLPQYSIFPIDKEKFQYIDRIYFYCNGFIENSAMWNWVNKNRLRSGIAETRTVRNYPKEDASAGDTISATGYLGKDIWTKGLEILSLKEIAGEYNGYKLKLSTPLGGIFYSTEESEELKIQADFTYRDYTELTDRAKIYWFRKDARVTAADHEGFDYHGGPGWHVMSKKKTSLNTITINAANNLAYKNEYMCAVAYSDTEQGDILLKQYITIYNEACKREIKIQSSLGETFKFDAGTPQLTCMIGEDEEHLLSQDFEINKTVKRQDEAFQFYWNIRTSNGMVYPLNQTPEEIQDLLKDTVDLVQRSKLESTKKYLEDVAYPKGVNGNQVEYPVKNFASNSNLTFVCQVYTTTDITSSGYLKQSADNTDWYSIGDAELTLDNQGVNALSEYLIVIENGDQVFQYSETGVAPIYASAVTASDFRHTDPLEIKELKAHLYYQNGLEVSEENYSVQWLYPTEESLIIPPDGLLIDSGTNQINLWQNRTATFNIKDSYDYDALDNQIQCVINFNNVTYTKYTDFTFTKIGDNGTNGTDITAKIIIKNKENFLDEQPLTAYLDKDNNFKRWNVGPTATLQLKLYNRSVELPSSDYSSYVVWDTAVGASRTQYVELTPQTDKTQCVIKWNKNKTVSGLAYRCQLIKVTARMTATGQEYHYTFPFCTIQENDYYNSPFTINQKEYLKQILYNSDGRNPQYNKNQGVKINNLDGRPIKWDISGGLRNYGKGYNTTDKEIVDVKEEESKQDYYYDSANQQKYKEPFFLTEEKDSKIQLSASVRYGLDKVFVHPLDIYAGESQDNNVRITVYDTSSAADLRSRWEAAKKDIDKDYETVRKKKADAITSVYTKASTEAANNAEKSNSSEDSLTDYLKLCGASWVTFNGVTGEIYVIVNGESLTLDEFSDSLSRTRQAEITRRYNIYKIYGITTAQDLLATDSYQQALKNAQDAYDELDDAYKTALEEKQKEIYQSICSDSNKYEIVVPLYLGLNTFGLASLNAWDGTKVDINEDLGYVLAPQIGAGQKHNDNTFSGILMGALESYDEYKKSDEDKTVGLMGFHHGLQSILLDAHTGKAIFGLPEQVRQYDGGELQVDRDGEVITETDYTQGRIILEPNGTSQIGMWKIGSRALYNKNQGPLLDGSYKYEDNSTKDSLEYAPAPGHIIDIPPVTPSDSGAVDGTPLTVRTLPNGETVSNDTYGVLLSADPPYLYIKGKRIEGVEESNAMAYINNGDSLGIQLDPQAQQSPFTIFRHYYDTKENKWKRQFRVGINSLGEFLANGLINPAKEESDAAKTTGTGIGPLGAFGLNAADGRYIGGRFTHGSSITPDKIIIKMFVDTKEGDEDTANRTLYISGATDKNNEYQRPISIHGKNIRMFADDGSNDKTNKTTKSCFVLDRNYDNNKYELTFLGHYDEDSNQPDGHKDAHYLIISDQHSDSEVIWGTRLRSDNANTRFILGKKFQVDVGETTVLNSKGNVEINPGKGSTWTIGLPHKDKDSDMSGAGTLYSGGNIKLYSNKKVASDNNQGWEFVLSEDKAFITQHAEGDAKANIASDKNKPFLPLFLMTKNEACWYAPKDIAIESNSGKIDIGANSTSGINIQTITGSSGSCLRLFANGGSKVDGVYQPEIQLIASLGSNKNKKITSTAVIEAMKTDMGSDTTAIWNIKPNIQTASIQLTGGSGITGENRAIHGDGAITIKTDSGALNLSPAGNIVLNGGPSKLRVNTTEITSTQTYQGTSETLTVEDDDLQGYIKKLLNHETYSQAGIKYLAGLINALTERVTNLEKNYNGHIHTIKFESDVITFVTSVSGGKDTEASGPTKTKPIIETIGGGSKTAKTLGPQAGE